MVRVLNRSQPVLVLRQKSGNSMLGCAISALSTPGVLVMLLLRS